MCFGAFANHLGYAGFDALGLAYNDFGFGYAGLAHHGWGLHHAGWG